MAPADPRYRPSSDGASAARASHGTHPSATAAEAPGTVSQRGRSGGAGGPADITRSLGRLSTRLESASRGDPEPRVRAREDRSHLRLLSPPRRDVLTVPRSANRPALVPRRACARSCRHGRPRAAHRARLLGRARHLGHPALARRALPRGGGGLLGRPGPGRGARRPGGEGAPHRRHEDDRRGPARGVRPRLRVPDVPRRCDLREPVPPRHLDRPPADRQAADRDRPPGARRRGRARRHRQGQRPGALRADLRRARPRAHRDRALARVGHEGPRGSDRLRRAAPHPGRGDAGGHGPARGLPGGRILDPRPGSPAPPRRARAALRRDGLLRLLVRARARHAPGRDQRGGARGDGHGAPPALSRQRARRRAEGATLALRSEARELRRGRRLPPGGRRRVHPALGPATAHQGAGRAHASAQRQMTRRRARARAAKAWAGRFATPTAPAAEAFTTSLPFDRRFYPHDIAGSVAHTRALVRARLLTGREGTRLERGLVRVRRELDAGRFRFLPSDEDIHMAIERRLTELVGPVGGKLHTGRSRNDQVALDLRLWLRAECDALDAALARLQQALTALARRYRDALLPGYTHLQRAQPILLAHHLLAYREMLARDRTRLRDCRARTDELPLGAGALAGAGFPLDRRFVARQLGFARVTDNRVAAVARGDAAAEFLAAAAITAVHLSRLAEEIVLWASEEFGFVELPDAFATGSSR